MANEQHASSKLTKQHSALAKGMTKNDKPIITAITYTENATQEAKSEELAFILPPKNSPGIIWINIEGLNDTLTINQLAEHFNLHPLTTEDILNIEQRPKVEAYNHYIFISFKVLYWHDKKKLFAIKQLSIVLGKTFVLTFQEWDTTLFDTIRKHLQSGMKQRLRELGSDYLVYRLLDEVIDNYFLVLEELGDKIEKIENRIISSTKIKISRGIYNLKRQLLILRRAIWPLREACGHLTHVEDELISSATRLYFRDVYDHIVQAIDTIEIYRDILSSMMDMYLSSLTNRMNEIMKTLTIITTIFIPITAVASFYGMNFNNLPGLHSGYGYVVTLLSMIVIAISMLLYFRYKRWL